MNLRTGELTIKKKGIYFFYSHVSFHVNQVDIFTCQKWPNGGLTQPLQFCSFLTNLWKI